MNCLTWSIALVAAYLIGAIPFGWLIGMMHRIDVRTVGSGNIGATNVYRSVGHKWGIIAFVCDFLKGFVPTLVAAHCFADVEHLPIAVGLMTVIGHMYTCFMGFKGGKGIATGFGMLVALAPWLVLTSFALFCLTVWRSHYISLGSILAAAFLAVTTWIPIPFLNPQGFHNIPLCTVITFVGVFAIWKHRANIARLRAGTESKIY